jgi:hypothetical protein
MRFPDTLKMDGLYPHFAVSSCLVPHDASFEEFSLSLSVCVPSDLVTQELQA